MTGLLADYELKRGRAMLHLDALTEPIQRFDNREPEFVLGEPDPNGSKYLFRVPLEPVDSDWALIIGDFVYERRASLDYLITALVRRAGKEEHDASQFPIHGCKGLPLPG